MINHVSCFSAVQIYDLLYIHLHNHLLWLYYELTKSYQLVEHCTGISSRGHGFESRSGLNFFFSGFNLTTTLSCVHNCDVQSCLFFISFSAVQIYDLSYIQLFNLDYKVSLLEMSYCVVLAKLNFFSLQLYLFGKMNEQEIRINR